MFLSCHDTNNFVIPTHLIYVNCININMKDFLSIHDQGNSVLKRKGEFLTRLITQVTLKSRILSLVCEYQF